MKNNICIIGGLGHVGLPLGIVFANKGYNVILHDVNQKVGEKVMRGELPYVEYDAEPLLKRAIKNHKLEVSLNPEVITESKYVIIAIGTPVDEYLNPKTREFLLDISKLKQYLNPSQIIIIRSSVFPKICKQILNVLGGEEWHLAYCPERIVQGYAVKELIKLPQIIAGYSDVAIKEASKLFKDIASKIIVTSMGEAELVKLFSNSWRYIQFAIANQYYMIAEDFGENYDRIREIMIDGYDRAKGLPSAGFAAGPCLLKDTMQILAFNNNQFLLGQAAMNINEGLPDYIINKLSIQHDLSKKTVGILGMAFKGNVDDIRDSLSFKIRKILNFYGARVICSDYFVEDSTFLTESELIDKSDIIIVGTPHDKYRNLDVKGKELIDIWNIINSNKS